MGGEAASGQPGLALRQLGVDSDPKNENLGVGETAENGNPELTETTQDEVEQYTEVGFDEEGEVEYQAKIFELVRSKNLRKKLLSFLDGKTIISLKTTCLLFYKTFSLDFSTTVYIAKSIENMFLRKVKSLQDSLSKLLHL